MVDSTPTSVGPPSRIISTRLPRSSATCDASVGLTRPERLAEGAAIGLPKAASNLCATGWAGARIATESSPARASAATGQVASAGTTSVSGPGQNAFASTSASPTISASFSAAARSATWAMRGLNEGRSLAA